MTYCGPFCMYLVHSVVEHVTLLHLNVRYFMSSVVVLVSHIPLTKGLKKGSYSR